MSDAATSVNASAAAPSANAVARRRKHEMHFTASARREAKGAFYLGALSTGFTLVEAYAMRTAPELFGKAPMWALPVGLGVGAGLMASSYAVGQGEPYRGHVAAASIAFGAMTSMIVRSRKTRFPYVSLAFVYGMGATYHSGKSSDWAEVQTFNPTEAE